MKVEQHIGDLLYVHDCVIVPNFGGFVANYSSAKIHPSQHTFSPPSKNIVFNKNLNSNDGLLANCISSIEKIGYPEAMESIEQFVSSSNALLMDGKKVKLNNIGSLALDVERNIQFTPSTNNFNLDSFGLSDFQSPAIKRDNLGKRLEKEFKDRDAIPLEKRKTYLKRSLVIALLFPIIFGMIWIPLKTDLLKNINYSNVNPFASKEKLKEEPVKVVEEVKTTRGEVAAPELKKEVTNTNLAETGFSEIDSSQNTTLIIASQIHQPATSIEEVKADTTHVAPVHVVTSLNFKFHLVTGCFSVESNAINFVSDLRNQQLQASIIGKRNGLYVVSCGDYATRKEALNNLAALKMNQPNAWLLKK